MVPELVLVTGDAVVDRLLRGVVGIFEAACPGQVRGYYLEGSQADGSSVATSDIDLTIVFKQGPIDEGVRQTAAALREACSALSAVELDIDITDEDQLRNGASPLFKYGSRLLFGEDIRDRVPLLSLPAWARHRMHAAYWLMIHAFGRPPLVDAPLDYPDADDEFFGYARRSVKLPNGRLASSTRNLIRVTGWIGTARLAREAGQYVARKQDCHLLYQRWIGDEWASLLAEIYVACRGAWSCLIPDDVAERQRLRAICEQTVNFEADFIGRYTAFLITELRTADTPSRAHALSVLARMPILDAGIEAAIEECRHAQDAGLRMVAETTARRYLHARMAPGSSSSVSP